MITITTVDGKTFTVGAHPDPYETDEVLMVGWFLGAYTRMPGFVGEADVHSLRWLSPSVRLARRAAFIEEGHHYVDPVAIVEQLDGERHAWIVGVKEGTQVFWRSITGT